MASGEWLIGDRRRRANLGIPNDTSRMRAALIIGSLIGLALVSIGVAVLV
jgi:hypothetical protein